MLKNVFAAMVLTLVGGCTTDATMTGDSGVPEMRPNCDAWCSCRTTTDPECVSICESDHGASSAVGCGAEWNAIATCEASARCGGSTSGCESEHAALVACEDDARCSDERTAWYNCYTDTACAETPEYEASRIACIDCYGSLNEACSTPFEPVGVYADVQWQVRCQIMGMCTPPPARSVLGFNLENNQRISCSVVETGATRTLSFSVSSAVESIPFGLTLTNAILPRSGGSPTTDCQVTVTEGSNTFAGVCGASAPSEGQPCQLASVQFTTAEDGRSLIRGEIYCVGISHETRPDIDREVTAPGGAAGTEPLVFSLYDCAGYTPG